MKRAVTGRTPLLQIPDADEDAPEDIHSSKSAISRPVSRQSANSSIIAIDGVDESGTSMDPFKQGYLTSKPPKNTDVAMKPDIISAASSFIQLSESRDQSHIADMKTPELLPQLNRMTSSR